MREYSVSLVLNNIILLGSKSQEITTVGEDIEKRDPVHCWWECKLVQPLWRTIWRFFKKVKIDLSYDPAILLLGSYPEELKTLT